MKSWLCRTRSHRRCRRRRHRLRRRFGWRWLVLLWSRRGRGCRWPSELAAPGIEAQFPRMRQHRVVAGVVRHHHEARLRLARRDVADVCSSSVESPARSCPRRTGAPKSPCPCPRYQRAQLLPPGLHILPIDEQVPCGPRRGRFRMFGRVLLGVLAQLALHRLSHVHARVVNHWNSSSSSAASTTSAIARFLGVWVSCLSRAATLRCRACLTSPVPTPRPARAVSVASCPSSRQGTGSGGWPVRIARGSTAVGDRP